MKRLFLLCLLPLFACTESAEEILTGEDLVRAMHDRYEARWYEYLHIEQKVTFYNDGSVNREEVWNEYLHIPGNVRSVTEPAEDGNFEIFTRDSQFVVRENQLTYSRRVIHTLLLLGFDVYRQPPESTISRLKEAKIDLSRLYESTSEGRPVYVVGAVRGDELTNQFWVDKEHLTFVREKKLTDTGDRWDIVVGGYQQLGEGWIGTQISFTRNDELLVKEEYLKYAILDKGDPSWFVIPQ